MSIICLQNYIHNHVNDNETFLMNFANLIFYRVLKTFSTYQLFLNYQYLKIYVFLIDSSNLYDEFE